MRDEARERVRRVEGREISQVTGKGNLLKDFPQGSPGKSFLWLLCGKQAEGSQNRGQRPEGVVQMGDEPHMVHVQGAGTGWFPGKEASGSPQDTGGKGAPGGGKAEPASCAHPLCSSGPPGKLPRHISGEEQRPGTACTGGPCSGRPPTALSGKQVTHEESCQPTPDDKRAQAQRQRRWGDPALLAPFRGKK